jgi:hypothetical protein
MEFKMIGVIVGVTALASIGLTLVVEHGIIKRRKDAPVEMVAATATVVDATGDAVEGGITAGGEAAAAAIDAATAEARMEAATRKAIAESEPAVVATRAAVDVLSPRSIGALAAYDFCLAASMGKQEGSAAYGCQDRGKALDAALAAEPDVVVCSGEDCPAEAP